MLNNKIDMIIEDLAITQTKKNLTEDTGKIFEMAICLAYGILYDGKYKYSMEMPEKIKPRLTKLVELFIEYNKLKLIS